jgi:glycosyltransferase involved in cell wall biosynthesis
MVVHAGSERVVENLLAEFPDAELLTTIANPKALPPALRRARTSFLQRIPGATSHHQWLLPLMPLAWRFLTPSGDVDAVISSSHACAKAVRVPPGRPHVCYCHTPMRYAWDFAAERERFPRPVRPPAAVLMRWFRRWDRQTAATVSHFVANSSAVAGRIKSFYGRTARVVHPPVRTGYFTPASERGDEFLYVGRLVGYKRADLVVEAFAELPYRLAVVGTGHLEPRLRATAGPNVRFLGEVPDAELRNLYRSARALVYLADEDFGIAMAEAQACGTPVLALARGGAVDIVEPDVTGWLLERQDVGDLRNALRRAAGHELDAAEIRARAERFGEERFRREMRDVVESAVAGA